MLSAAVTGHTRGIGFALSKCLSDAGYDVRGYSRSNGYTLPEKSQLVVHSAKHADVFVNNAYSGMAQCDLFNAVYKLWKNDSSKTIVNIISMSKFLRSHTEPKIYSAEKAGLELVSKQALLNPDRKCRIININPGYVRTDMIKHLHDQHNMLTAEQLAEAITWCITQPQGVEVGELSIWATTLN